MEYTQPSKGKERPTGVTILAVLYVLHGLFWLSMMPIITYLIE